MAASTRRLPCLCMALALSIAWGNLASGANLQLFLGDTAVGPAIGSQNKPVIAAGGGGFLAVWQDLNTSPFIGPPFSPEGRGFDIYIRRLDASGAPIDAAPVLIAKRFGDQTAPQVAWNGQNWLVTWGGPNSTQWNHRIMGVRIAPDGTVLDDPPITINTTVYSSRFALTSNGGEWLVVSQSSGAGEADIRGFRISALGELINAGGTQLLPTSTSLFGINVASAQGEYLLLWGNSAFGPRGQRYDASLNPIGSPFPASSIQVASNGTEYFLVWSINDTYWDDFVYGQRLSIDGIPGPVVTVAGAGGGLPLWSPPETDVGWDGVNWWVSWVEITGSVAFARVTPDDVVLDFGGLPVDPTAPDRAALEHDIAGATLGGVQIVWADARAGGASLRDIHTAAVGADATPGPAAPISTSARAQLRLDFAVGHDSANNEQVLAVYLSEHSGDRKIVGQRLDPQGVPIDLVPFEIASGSAIGTPHVGFDGTRYLVVWPDAGQTYGKRVHPDGSLIDATPLSIMDSESPDVAGLNGVFLVVGTRPTIGAHFVHPFSMRVDGATGATLDPEPVILGQYFARFPRVIAFAGRWLATWQRNITHDNPNSSAFAAFVEADGTTAGEFRYGPGGATPDVATSGDRALFVWRLRSAGSGHNDVQGLVMLADGTFLSGPFSISAAASPIREFDPAATWNGTEFVVAWTDERSEVIYFDARSEVFAARVLTDGTVLDPAGFSFGDVAEHEILSGITSVQGRTIIAASSFRDDPAKQTFRIAYQVRGDSPLGNRWPVAMASVAPASGDVPFSVSFSAAGSYDPDGAISSYAWAFGDGATGTGASPAHTYTVPGEYVAELTVTDNQGASTSNTVRVIATAVNQPPVAVASADPTSGRAPLSVVYQAAGSYDPDDGIAQIFWEFGDGWTYYGGTAYHTYSAAGTWLTTLTITDHSGATATDTVQIVVDPPNQPPLAVASASPLSGISPLSVGFSPVGSSDPDGSITGYRWDFGDGNISTDPSPTHVYQIGGLFQATLTVTDNEGASGTDTVTIDVLQGDLTSVANADFATEAGAISAGSYLDTQAGDGVVEALSEETTGGKPSKRRSRMSHVWRFDVAAGPNHKFYVDAHHNANGEGDDFAFEYSRDGTSYAPMLVVNATAPGGALQSYAFTQNVSGTLYVRAVDTDRTGGNNAVDTLYVDEMFVVTSWQSGGDTTPPAAPSGLAAAAGDASVTLDWTDNAEADLAGYHVHRSTQGGGPYAPITAAPVVASAYVDSGVVNGTTYYYVVTAIDTSDNASASSTEVSTTPQSSGGATTMHVASVLVSSLNAGKGAKRGRAEVMVINDQGAAVPGVAVTGSFTGDITEVHTETTGADGVAVFTTAGTKKRGLSFTFCVDGVTGAGLTYDAAANAQTCNSF